MTEGIRNGFTPGILHQEFSIPHLGKEKLQGKWRGTDILSFEQFDPLSLSVVFSVAERMREIAKSARPSNILKGNLVTLLFYEPSSRTRGSFDAATKQLGGDTIVVENPQQFSSVAKGESLRDTIRTLGAYCDVIVLRHPIRGTAVVAAEVAKEAEGLSIINAGDGTGEHPTQTLLDLFTIHSLLHGLAMFPDNTVYLLSPEQLQLSREEIGVYENQGIRIEEIDDISQIPPQADFWYWTRVQKERFESEEEYQKVNNKFIVNPAVFDRYANEGTILMHPLPRVGEITEEMDKDPRSVYLREQVRNGMYTRMALLSLVTGKVSPMEVFDTKPFIF